MLIVIRHRSTSCNGTPRSCPSWPSCPNGPSMPTAPMTTASSTSRATSPCGSPVAPSRARPLRARKRHNVLPSSGEMLSRAPPLHERDLLLAKKTRHDRLLHLKTVGEGICYCIEKEGREDWLRSSILHGGVFVKSYLDTYGKSWWRFGCLIFCVSIYSYVGEAIVVVGANPHPCRLAL